MMESQSDVLDVQQPSLQNRDLRIEVQDVRLPGYRDRTILT
jgi:hypothetical protein